MFEFLNWGLIVPISILIGVCIWGIFTSERKNDRYLAMLGLISLVAIIYFEYLEVQKKIKKFNQGETILCSDEAYTWGGNRGKHYLVQNDLWEQEHYNFIKNDNRLILEMANCYKFELAQ